MPSNPQNNGPATSTPTASNPTPGTEAEKVLCQHCGRTATNGVKCRGWCLPDEY